MRATDGSTLLFQPAQLSATWRTFFRRGNRIYAGQRVIRGIVERLVGRKAAAQRFVNRQSNSSRLKPDRGILESHFFGPV